MLEILTGQSAAFGQLQGGGQVGFQLLTPLLPQNLQIVVRHKAALARHGVDEAVGFQFVVGPLGGDDRDLEILGQSPDGGQCFPRRQGAGEDLRLDLTVDLIIDRLVGGVSDDEFHGSASVRTVHVQYIQYAQFVKRVWKKIFCGHCT